MQVTPELKGMLARGIGNMVDELDSRVWSLEFRPLERAQPRDEGSGKTDAGQAAGIGAAHASVKAVSGRRRIQIARQRGLVEPVVADPDRTSAAKGKSGEPGGRR